MEIYTSFNCGFNNRKRSTKIGCTCSLWKELLYSFPQGSILGPLLFGINLCDLFLLKSYSDDTTPCVLGENTSATIESLKKASALLFQWFSDNHIKANEDKCQVL